MGSKLTIGGQAVIEGVMMRSLDKYAIAVRKPDNKISTKIIKIKSNPSLAKFPIIRGCFRFVETLVIGMKGISYSASESMGQDEEFNSWEMFVTIILSIVMSIGLFYMAPLFLAKYLTTSRGFLFNLLDGIIRLAIFLSYLLIISLLPDVKRIFQYHGAEHKTVFCYENKKALTVKNIKKYSTLHPRCGTNFILIVFVLSILFFSFISVQGIFNKLGMRLLLLPLIAGISYEFLKFAGNHFDNVIVKSIIYPGLLLQRITTKEPEDKMIQVAIKALKAAIS